MASKAKIDYYCTFKQCDGIYETMPVQYKYVITMKPFSEFSFSESLSEQEKKQMVIEWAKDLILKLEN